MKVAMSSAKGIPIPESNVSPARQVSLELSAVGVSTTAATEGASSLTSMGSARTVLE